MILATLRLPAEVGNLAQAQDFLLTCAGRFGLDTRPAGRLALALEEVFVNICHYAYPERAGMVELNCRVEDERFVMEIADEGVAFDALSLPEPDLAAGLDERRIGGLGWFLVRQLADELDCRRENGRNIVRIALRRNNSGAGATDEG